MIERRLPSPLVPSQPNVFSHRPGTFNSYRPTSSGGEAKRTLLLALSCVVFWASTAYAAEQPPPPLDFDCAYFSPVSCTCHSLHLRKSKADVRKTWPKVQTLCKDACTIPVTLSIVSETYRWVELISLLARTGQSALRLHCYS